jgi:hypothetical protein
MKPAGFLVRVLMPLTSNTAAFRESLDTMGGRGFQWIFVGNLPTTQDIQPFEPKAKRAIRAKFYKLRFAPARHTRSCAQPEVAGQNK